MTQRVIAAIGDVHGEADRLRQLHRALFERRESDWPGMELMLVHLGDYVDRGPDSYGVIETILALEDDASVQTVNLRGNHEQMMIEALQGAHSTAKSTWLRNGGEETLSSYNAAGFSMVPERHTEWLLQLPTIYEDAVAKLIFVHAGIDPAAYPDDRPEIHMWTRSKQFFETRKWKNPALEGWQVVHGHTPTSDFLPERDGDPTRRVNIDTGAVYGGRLTAAVFVPGNETRFLYA